MVIKHNVGHMDDIESVKCKRYCNHCKLKNCTMLNRNAV